MQISPSLPNGPRFGLICMRSARFRLGPRPGTAPLLQIDRGVSAPAVSDGVQRISFGRPARASRVSRLGTWFELGDALDAHVRANVWRYEPAEGGVVTVAGGTELQSANHGPVELTVYAYGYPPDEGAEVLDSAI